METEADRSGRMSSMSPGPQAVIRGGGEIGYRPPGADPPARDVGVNCVGVA
jgi:hypothetical protein